MNIRDIVLISIFFLITTEVSNAEDLIARVYGQPVYRSDISFSKEQIDQLKRNKSEKEVKEILERTERLRLAQLIFDRAYSVILGEKSYTPTEQEVQSFLKAIPDSKEIKELNARMTPEQQKKSEESRYKMAQQFVQRWKISKRLYEKYGGRILFQQAGLEPIDAYRMFINEVIKSGKVEIVAPEFGSILTPPLNEKGVYMSEKEAKTAFDKPWWENKR